MAVTAFQPTGFDNDGFQVFEKTGGYFGVAAGRRRSDDDLKESRHRFGLNSDVTETVNRWRSSPKRG